MNINIIEILKSSPTLVALIVLSIIALMAFIERFWYFRKNKLDVRKFMEKILNFVEKSSYEDAVTFCDKHVSPIAAVIKVGIVNRKSSKEHLSELMESQKMEQRIKMDSWLGILGTLGSICPFVGLLGTVVGIIKSFQDLAQSGSGGPAIVAKGIAEALVATAGGLLVAIPCVVAFNYFMRRIKVITTDMDVAMKRLIVYLDK